MTLEAGTRLGHYRIIALLGRGGMADVYRAEDERLGREVALKVLPPEFARDPERIERFEREVRAAAKLTHPNIVTVYEYGVGEEHPFYTMALLPGGDLKVRIRAHPDGMPPSEALKVTAAMARALEYAHGQGFVHRDIKPENILFTADGTPQLTDFGIARAMSEGTRMTATGMSIGSPHYMSPEQARGQAVDGRSDLYSLGVVLYEMLTGRVPFDASDTFAVGLSHINDPVPALPGRLSAWQPVVERLLAKSPEDRHGSAGELAEVLSSDAPPQAQPTRLMERPRDVRRAARAKALATWLASLPKPRRGLRAALVGGVLAVVAVGIVYVAMQQGAVGPERQPFNGGGGSAAVQPAPVQTAPPSNPANPFDLNSPEIVRSDDDGGDPGEATETPVLSPAALEEQALGLDRPARQEIQAGLVADGFDPGEPDGALGARTRAALRAWQAARGRYLDAESTAALGAAVRRHAELEAEAQRQAEARRQAELEAEARRQAELEAEARRQAALEAEARRRAAVTLVLNRPSEGTIPDGDAPTGVWFFEGVAGQVVSVEARSDDFDTTLRLVSPSGDRLSYDNGIYRTNSSMLRAKLQVSGRYQIMVLPRYRDADGTYKVVVNEGVAYSVPVLYIPGFGRSRTAEFAERCSRVHVTQDRRDQALADYIVNLRVSGGQRLIKWYLRNREGDLIDSFGAFRFRSRVDDICERF